MATRVSLMPSVLLVNDVLDECAVYTRTLRAAGHRVITAEDSAAAYRIATERSIDIVVTDVRLTGSCSGLELTRRLRSDERTSAVGIVVLTSVSRSHDAHVALMAGADRVLEKPVESSLLTCEIRRLLSRSARQSLNSTDSLEVASLKSGRPVGTGRTCPWCSGTMVHRERWPMLASDGAQGGIGRERLHYVSGWFCTNPACDHHQLSRGPR